MHRTTGEDYQIIDGKRQYVAEVLPDQEATRFTAESANSLQEEIAYIIEACGLTLAPSPEEDRTAGFHQLYNAIFGAKKLGLNAITSGSLDESVLVNRTITANKIAESGVTEVNLGVDSVTETKIKNANVTLNKLATNSVNGTKIVDGAVATAKIAANAVTRDKTTDLDNLTIYTGTATTSTQSFTLVRSVPFIVYLTVNMTKTSGTAGSTGQNKFRLTDNADVDIANGSTIIRLAEMPLDMSAVDKSYRFPVHLPAGTFKLVVDCSVGTGEALSYFIQVESKD